jgi:hypothetical protein
MIYELLACERVAEALLEAEKAHLIEMAKKPRADRTDRLLTVFLCRVGLISAC